MLTAKGIPFEEIDVTNDPAARQDIAKRSGKRTVPQIFIGDESIGGFMELKALSDKGQLEAKLAG